jgi:PAS domain S-box-containing protein
MNSRLRILHLEDSRRDAELIHATLESEGLDFEVFHVKNKEEFETAITQNRFDVILSDFALPHYNGLTALDFARSRVPSVPFILLSGTVGEEVAVQSLKTGATDYILKQKPARLAQAIRRALEEAKERVRRQAVEEALRKSEERFQFASRATNDIIWDWDLETNDWWQNESFSKLFGYRSDEIEPKIHFWIDRLHPEDRERVLSGLHAVGRVDAVVWSDEYRFRRRDGTYADIFDRAYVIHNANGKAVRMIGAMMDISQRKQAEEKVREQAALLDKAQDAIHVRDLEGRICYWNKGATRVYGWTESEVLGKKAHELLARSDSSQMRQAIERVRERGEWVGEVQQLTKSGEAVEVESRWTLMRNGDGKPKCTLVIDTDITEKKRLEAQFLRAQRMESIGALAGGIAHDLNNILSPILMAADFLHEELAASGNHQMVDIIKTSAQRGSDMVKQILSFARGVSGEPTMLQVRHLVTDFGKLLKETFPRSIQIQTIFAKDLRLVKGDATQLHQVLMNLCVNARDAMPDGGSLKIEAANVVLKEKRTRMQQQPVSGPYVVLTVADTGHGIPPHLLDKIYDPFFTTKSIGKGTGLGLSTVLSIVKTHNGFMEVSSQVGKGTSFSVYLPAGPASEETVAEDKGVPPPMGHGEQVLVVDDECAVLEITRETLGLYNYQVLTATNGGEAVTLYLQHRGQIKAVITDMMMPIMDGKAMIQALQKIDPTVKVICVSGLSSRPNLTAAAALSVRASLKKPFSSEKLLTTLRSVIDGVEATTQ